MVWPYWPTKLRTSSSHEEGCSRDWAVATKRLEGKGGKVDKLVACRVEWKDGKMIEVPGSEFEMKADLVLLAMGFVSPVQQVLDAFGVDKDARGNARATTGGDGWARFHLPRGEWWIYGRPWDATDPNAEWYWNLPVTADTLLLSSRTGRQRRRY